MNIALYEQLKHFVLAPCLLSGRDLFQGRPFHPRKWFAERMRPGQARIGRPPLAQKRCINNSIERALIDSLEYMEGYIYSCGIPIVHAWNQDQNGFWVDYTLREPEKHVYFGVAYPEELVLMAAEHPCWEMCCGVLETVQMFNDNELLEARRLLEDMYG